MKKILAIIFFAALFHVHAGQAAQIKVVPPEEAVKIVEEWLVGATDVYGINGIMVKVLVEYEHSYMMIISPQGWVRTMKTEQDDVNFIRGFGGGKIEDYHSLERGFWGMEGGVEPETGVIVYENPDADKPKLRFYKGYQEFPYENRIPLEGRNGEWDYNNSLTFRGTASDDLFARGSQLLFTRSDIFLYGNGGSDIYDISSSAGGINFTYYSCAIKIEKKNPDERNTMIVGPFGMDHFEITREGDDLHLLYTSPKNDLYSSHIRLIDWYKGPDYQMDAIYYYSREHGWSNWDLKEMGKIAKWASLIHNYQNAALDKPQ
jgi:hypothetical protein